MNRSKLLSGALTALVLVSATPSATPDRATPAPLPELAATASGAASSAVLMGALMKDIQMVEQKLTSLGEAMSEEGFAWRPAEGVRSTNEVLMHIAADNYFLPAAGGTAAPEQTGIQPDSYASVQAFEGRSVSREEAMAEMEASFEHLRRAMESVDDAALAETVSIFGNEFTGLELWVLTTTHLHEHLGQLIAYARTNGVRPPWSQ